MCWRKRVAAMESGTQVDEVSVMSGTDNLRAVRESRASAEERANRRGRGEAMARLVDAVVYRATRRPVPEVGSPSVQHAAPVPLGPGFRSAIDTANARIDALGLSSLRTPEGTVRYLVEGAGAPVLLVHGIFGGADAALRQLRPLVPEGFRLIVPSRFGYLGSSLPSRATPRGQADAFAVLLDRLGVEKTAVVAVSAGATSALQLAMWHPGRVSALVLLSPNGTGPQHDRRTVPARVMRAVWGSDRLMWMVRRQAPQLLTRLVGMPADQPLDVVDRARLDAELDGIFPVARRADGVLFDVYVSNPDINNYDFQGVSVPTLVVHARDDALAPCWGGIGLAQRMPGCWSSSTAATCCWGGIRRSPSRSRHYSGPHRTDRGDEDDQVRV
jgi:pimeloyl-ACP methyl ester carboxylesterase